MSGRDKKTPSRPRWAVVLCLIGLTISAPAAGAEGDTVADRVLGQRRFSTSFPFFLDARVFSAASIAFDRSVVPNRVYVADAGANRVLGWADEGRFLLGLAADLVLGQPSFFAGSRVYDQRDCPAPPSATSFCGPTNLAVDPAGNLYVVDLWNHRVLEFDSPFTTDQTADRVFGQPDFTSRRDPARGGFSDADIALDAAGNLWVVNPTGSRQVLGFDAPLTHDTLPDRVIEPADLETCAQSRPVDRPCNPAAVTLDPEGNLYVGDVGIFQGGGRKIWVYLQPLTDLVSDFSLSTTTSELPAMVFDEAGNLYLMRGIFVSRYSAPVTAASAAAFPETVLITHRAEFYGRPARDSAGNIFVPNFFGIGSLTEVVVLEPPFNKEPRQLRRSPQMERSLFHPYAVAVDRSSSPNHLYAVDLNNRVLGWRDAAAFANGAPADLVIGGDLDCLLISAPVDASRICTETDEVSKGLAVDSRGNLWVADVYFHRVLELDRPFDTDTVADRVLGQRGSFTTRDCNKGGRSARSLCFPGALAFDREDNLYVSDLYNHRVLLFKDPLRDAVADKVFGQANFRQGACNRGASRPGAQTLCFGYEDGSVNVHFYAASGLAVDDQGNLFVSDPQNSRVLMFMDALRSDAVADRVLGQDGSFNTTEHGAGPDRFGKIFADNNLGPAGLAIGPAGELYVADTENDRILVFDNPLRRDVAVRLFGHEDFTTGGMEIGYSPLSTGRATASNLLRPYGLAFDEEGNLYVADTYQNRILAYDRP